MSRRTLIFCIVVNVVASLALLATHFFTPPAGVTFWIKVVLLVGAGGTLVTWSVRRLMPEERADGLVSKLTLLAFGLGFALVVGEIAVRIMLRDVTSTGDATSLFARRWTSDVTLNSRGFREHEYEVVKPEGLYRIAVVGDSFTYGQGVPMDDRFSNLLQQALNDGTDGRYEVVNFGLPGRDLKDHVVTLRETALEADPDFVLLQWYINDFNVGSNRGRPMVPLAISARLHEKFNGASALYFLLNNQWLHLQPRLGLGVSQTEYLYERLGDPANAESKQAMAVLEEIIDACAERDLPLGIVLFPSLASYGTSYPFEYLHERVIECGERHDIQCVDLRSAYAAAEGRLGVNRFDGHPSALAHRIATDRLLEAFGPTWEQR